MSHHESLFVNIKRYRKNQQFCDITFDVMGTKFHLHKLVISSASNFFEAMFTKDVIKPDQKEVALKGVTPSAFEGCIDFIYEGTTNIEEDGIDNLFHAATLFQLEVLMKKCIDQIRNITHVKNCVKFYQLSLKEECQEIEEKSKDVMLKNAENILTDDSIISTMDEESLSMMLKSDELNISDESVAFQALVKWTDMDKERMDAICELLQFVRLPIVSRDFFTSVIHENEHIQKKCAECKDYAQSTMLHLLDGKDHGLQQFQLEVRVRLLQTPKHDGIEASCDDESDHSEDARTSSMPSTSNDNIEESDRALLVVDSVCNFKLFDTATDTLSDVGLRPITYRSSPRSLVHYNNKIYAIGGGENNRRVLFCDYRDGKTWHDVPQLPGGHNDHVDRFRSSMIGFRGLILVIGGWRFVENKAEGSNFVSCFCTETNTWSRFPSLNIGRADSVSVATDKAVYVIGGYDNEILAAVEVLQSNIWKCAPSLNIARSNATAVYHNTKIFVSGGESISDRLSSVETFVEGDSSWTEIASLNIGRSDASMFTHHGKLYVFGGVGEDSNAYEVWCETSKTWRLSEVKISEGNYSLVFCKVLACNVAIKNV